jgi:hypothetical protein
MEWGNVSSAFFKKKSIEKYVKSPPPLDNNLGIEYSYIREAVRSKAHRPVPHRTPPRPVFIHIHIDKLIIPI